jgi:hydroxymethylpyrimidine pyrophosphatase-like HAD family hydrolase
MITVAFDVDGTILIDERNPDPIMFDTPNYDVIALFKLLEKLGCEMYIWSGGGKSYAMRWAMKFGLKAKIVDKGSFIPDIAIDDEEVNLGKVNIKI